jgi:hypothetical protein
VGSKGQITSDASVAQARKNAAYFKKLLQGGHAHGGGDGTQAMRTVDYKGHQITIKTTYRITIDGKLFKGALGVTNDGMVHYHGMPTAGFDSAVDLVKSVIDTFPGEFGGATEHDGHDHDGHDHDGHDGHDHDGHDGHDHDGHGAHTAGTHGSRRKAARPRPRRSR